MENLGDFNLFASQFIMGCELSDNKKITCIKTLHDWLEFKQTDYGMEGHRVNKTQYISFLHEIDLAIFNDLLNDLIKIYKNDFPYGEKEDFINHYFGYSIYYLERFISRDYLHLAYSPLDKTFDFYCFYHAIDKQYIDYAIPSNQTIEHYKQYYKRVLVLINNVDLKESEMNTVLTPSIQNLSTDNMKNAFSGFEWAIIFYYYNQCSSKNNSFNKNALEIFIKKHNVKQTYNYLRKKYFEVDKRSNKDFSLSIGKLEKVIPFFNENYPEMVTYIRKEINYFKEESPDY